MTSLTDPLNHTINFGYDTSGNLTSVTDPLTHQTTMTYNAAGQFTSVSDPAGSNPAGTWQFGYTGGDLTSVIDPLGRTATRITDGGGRLVVGVDPLGRTTSYTYDGLDQLKGITDPLLGITSFSYDGNGNLTGVTDTRNNPTTYAYDPRNRLQTRTDPLQTAESYQYDGNNNLTRFTDRKNQATTIAYDGFNRPTTATFQDGSTTTYTFDAGSRLTKAVDSLSGTFNLTYDDLDRLTQEATPNGTLNYTYDNADRRASMTVVGQTQVGYTYDVADRLTNVTQGSSAVTIGYDAADRRISLTLPNGVVTQYGYDSGSQLTSLTYKLGGTTLGNLNYGYDGGGLRSSMGGSFARVSLPSALASASYDAANRLTQWGTTNLTYDANESMTNDGTNTFTWDARNRLSAMTGATFQYDPFGRRVNRSGAKFLYDGVNRVQELSGSTVTANLLTGLGVDETFTRADSAGVRDLLADALGSTVSLTDTSGTVQTQYTYEPFGKTTVSGPSNPNPLEYTGRENDGNGLYYYRARYYNPTFQRFISEDPLEFGGGDADLFAYASDDPSDFRDPFGLSKTSDNFLMGIVDGLSLGVRKVLPRVPGDDTDVCSFAYWAGEKIPLAFGLGRLAYAAAAKAIPIVYSQATPEAARSAVWMRNYLKLFFRAGTFPNAKMSTYTSLSALKNDEEIIAGAGRTNKTLNALGARISGSGIVNGAVNAVSGCDCK
jgi:RHS repeat-associated protein